MVVNPSMLLIAAGGIVVGIGASFSGLGGIIGAQIGARLVEHVSTGSFKKIFSLILVGLAGYLFFNK